MTVIEVDGLHKRYGSTVAVQDVSFTVRRGEIFGIVGSNGAGKTTTVECLSGLRTPDRGRVRVLGLDPTAAELRRRVGVQLQAGQLPEKMTVREALALYSACYPAPADVPRLVAELGLGDSLDTRYGKLSGGQQQRLSIALALVGDPEIAILDELTTGLDPQARRDTWDLVDAVRDRGVTVVLVSHFMTEVERLCDRVAVIARGRVTALDTPAGLIAGVGGGQTIRFRPSGPFDERELTRLPAVRDVRRQGNRVIVTGTGDLLPAVVAELARHDVTATGLRIEQSGMDDVFVALTGGSAPH